MSNTFEALADPTRRAILDLLREGELPAGALVQKLSLPQPAVSKQLKVLRMAGLVQSRADGQRRLYRLDALPLLDVDGWLAPYRLAWAAEAELPPAEEPGR